MSFDYNGTIFTPGTTLSHAQDALNYVNSIRAANGLSQIVPTIANVIWLLELANGNLCADYDQKLEAAATAWDVATASQDQILALLPMVGTSLIPATYSTVTLSCTASSGGDAVITAGAIAPYTSTINFIVDANTTVPAGTTVSITATCDTSGPIEVGIGQITSITGIANLQTVTNPAIAILGSNAETPDQARQRIIEGRTVEFNADGAARALQSLAGIQNAIVWFNDSTSTTLTLTGGATVAPRHARIVVNGTSTKIAETYFDRMSAPTDGTNTQNYTTLAGQTVAVKYDTASNQPLYVKVYYNQSLPTQTGYTNKIKELILAMQQYLTIGQTVTAEFIGNALNNFVYATITTVEVSLNGSSWSHYVTCDATALPVLSAANITITGE